MFSRRRQNLAVKGARITARNLATGAERATTSDPNGRYEVVGLTPGIYSLRVEAEGFAILENSSLTLTLGVAVEYNPQLQLKTATQTVSVSAEAALVETIKTDVSTSVTQTQIDNLERWNVEVIGDGFNMLNRRNISDVNPLCDPTSGSCTAGTPTASYDPRTFQFALKINW
jgi:hypothetical protein